jgi:hypothetical protein
MAWVYLCVCIHASGLGDDGAQDAECMRSLVAPRRDGDSFSPSSICAVFFVFRRSLLIELTDEVDTGFCGLHRPWVACCTVMWVSW